MSAHPDCGTLQELPTLRRCTSAVCPTCDRRLQRTTGRSRLAALLLASMTFVLLFPANLKPLMAVSVIGIDRNTYMGSGVFTCGLTSEWFSRC
jgi:paraquat-inducible protein A